MGELISKSEAEKRVLSYLEKNTHVGLSKFNPIKLTTLEIAKGVDLDVEDVEEALENLSDKSSRIEKVESNFDFWLPLCGEGYKIKKKIFSSNLAYYNLLLFWFLSIIVLFFISKWMISKKYMNIPSTNDLWILGAICAFVSFFLAKKISNKFYILNERLQRVKYYKISVWIFILSAVSIIYIFNKGLQKTELLQNILLGVAILANLVTIIGFIIGLAKKRK